MYKRTFFMMSMILIILLAALGWMSRRSASISMQGALLTKEAAVSHAQLYFGPNANTKLVDARLLYHEEAYKALGVLPFYEKMPAYPYRPKTLVWVITIVADDVSALTMFGGNKFAGAIFLIVAGDGTIEHLATVNNPTKDEDLLRIKALPDLDGLVKIEVLPTATAPGPLPPTPTLVAPVATVPTK